MEDIFIDFVRTFIISFYTYIFCLKITNTSNKTTLKEIMKIVISIFIITIICEYFKVKTEIPYFIIWNVILISIIFSAKTKITYINSIILITISLSINYLILIGSLLISFIISEKLNIYDKYINLFMIIISYNILIFVIIKTKRINKGIIFLKNKLKDEYLSILLLNISIFILYFVVILINHEKNNNRPWKRLRHRDT